MEPLQLGTLSSSLLEQRASEASQLLGTLTPTPTSTPQSCLLWATCIHPNLRGRGQHTSPSPRVIQAPGSALKLNPHPHPCLEREATVRNLTRIASRGERLPEGEEGRKKKPGAWDGCVSVTCAHSHLCERTSIAAGFPTADFGCWGAAPSKSGMESTDRREVATPERSRAPRSRRHRRWRHRARPPGTSAALGPTALLNPGRGAGGRRPGRGPRRARAATARPAPPPARRAAPRGAPAAPPTGCSRSSARRPGLWRPPASCSCFGAGCPDALRTARCAGAQGRRVGGGCVGEGPKGRIPGAVRPHPSRRARSLFLDKGLVATAQNPGEAGVLLNPKAHTATHVNRPMHPTRQSQESCPQGLPSPLEKVRR